MDDRMDDVHITRSATRPVSQMSALDGYTTDSLMREVCECMKDVMISHEWTGAPWPAKSEEIWTDTAKGYMQLMRAINNDPMWRE